MNRNFLGIIIYGVDFFGIAETFGDFVNAVQPFQGILTDVVSFHGKRRAGFGSLGLRKTGGNDNQK